MGLRTDQIVKILQLEKIGRKTAHKINDKAKNEIIDNDNDLKDFILGCIANKWVQKLPIYSNQDFNEAFEEGEKILEKSERLNITILSTDDKDFPKFLRDIPDKPIILNFRGKYKELNNYQGIAIIGTREPTKEGIVSGEHIGEYFGRIGFNVVSGLAKGCDSSAHRGCLKGNGFTTAIVAHGLHMTYPKENRDLAESIVDSGGVLLSEYFVTQGAIANFFVERDRLQAGLSVATVVIQTDIKGGTMHAVNATLESEKLLAAVQYNPNLYSEKIRGNNLLISRGAFPLTSKNLEDFENKIRAKLEKYQLKSELQNLNNKIIDTNKNLSSELNESVTELKENQSLIEEQQINTSKAELTKTISQDTEVETNQTPIPKKGTSKKRGKKATKNNEGDLKLWSND